MAVSVVNLVDYVTAGGAERAAVEIAKRMASAGTSTMVSSRLDETARDHPKYAGTIAELEAAGVRWIGLGRTSTAKAWEWRPLVRLLRRERVDVLHSYSWGSNFWAPALGRLGGVGAVVAHEQTPFARAGGVRAWGSQAIVNRWVTGPFADAVIVPSQWSRTSLIEHEGVPARKIHVIPNGAPERPAARRHPAVTRAALGLEPADVVVVIAAMLRPEKAQDVLIRALATLVPRHPRLRLLVVGGGTPARPSGTRPKLEAVAREVGVAERVRFLGRRDDVADVVEASDVAVLCSRAENLPLAVVEYMEAGTPIVATDVGGVRELVEDEVHALLVPPDDAPALAAAIDRVLQDPAAAATRAAAARDRRRATFDWDVIGQRVHALHRELLVGGRAHRDCPAAA